MPLYTTKLTENLINDKITVGEINGEVGFYLSQKLRLSLNDNGHKKPIKLSTNVIVVSTIGARSFRRRYFQSTTPAHHNSAKIYFISLARYTPAVGLLYFFENNNTVFYSYKNIVCKYKYIECIIYI